MTLIRPFLILFVFNVFTTNALANATTEAQEYFESLVNVDLLQFQSDETYTLNKSEVRKLNEENFQRLENFDPRPIKGRVNSIPLDYADLVYDSINQHPVVSEFRIYDYRNGHQIGFCFGRATYVHLALIRSGVNKRSIKKIWAVGPMVTGDTAWQFHVATAVLADDGEWYAIDTFQGQVVPVRAWFKTMLGVATDGSLRFYVTEPRKFSVSLGEYSRIELGLDLNEDQDWYTHYFKKLMKWTADESLESVGLYDLRTQNKQ